MSSVMEEDTEKKGWALETECHDEIHAADAAEAAKIERDTSLWHALKAEPKAVLWSVAVSTAM
jgi:hypothetical protein